MDPGIERQVSHAFRVETRSSGVAGAPAAELLLNDELMCRITAAEGQSAMERARAIQGRLTGLFDQGLTIRDLRLSADQSQVLVHDVPLLVIHPSDAVANKMSVTRTSKRAMDVILKALWKEQLDLTF